MFGEDFVIRPYAPAADKRAPDAPDTSRAVVTLMGIWREKTSELKEPNAYDTREYRRPGLASEVPTIEFSAAALSAFVTFEIRDGDHIERLATRNVYRARTATFSANGTLRVPLNRLGPL